MFSNASSPAPVTWQPAIVAENFRRGERSHRCAFLDGLWTMELPDVGAQDPSLKPPLDPTFPCDLQIEVAGKQEGPDATALALARKVMEQLSRWVHLCNDLVGFETDEGDWSLWSIAVPYQVDGLEIWFVECISDYGSDLTFAWQRTLPGGDPVLRVLGGLGGEHEELVASVPHTVKWIVDDLARRDLSSPTWAGIQRTIRDTRTMGCDLIVPLINVLDESREIVGASKFEHWMKYLSAIRRHARP